LTKDATTGAMSMSYTPQPAVPGQSYSARARFQAVTTGRTCNTFLDFLDAGSAIISTASSTGTANSTGAYVTNSVMGVAPAGTVTVRVRTYISTPVGAEAHRIDDIYVQEGAAATPYGGVTADALNYWRARVQDGAGIWSNWSLI
jgi:hypothetical protein